MIMPPDGSQPVILPGDVFLASRESFLFKAIQFVEEIWSSDHHAIYGHAGLIVDQYGKTSEALWRVGYGKISNYKGQKVLIARPVYDIYNDVIIEPIKMVAMYKVINKHHGQFYPVHRLFLHLFKPLAKYFSTGYFVVCSEYVDKYMYYLRTRDGTYKGVTPDNLHDRWRRSSNVRIIYEGEWKW